MWGGEMKKLFIGDSLYTLLIFLLVEEYRDDSIYIFGKTIEKGDLNLNGKKYFFYEDFKRYKKSRNIFIRGYISFKILFLSFLIGLKYKKTKRFGSDHLFMSRVFLKKGFTLIEDGSANYVCKKNFGRDKKVEKIYLSGMGEIPQEIREKTKIINLKALWKKKDDFEKNSILRIFKIKGSMVEKIREKTMVLLTQPLSEDGVIDEKRKIELYENILKNYDRRKIFIKKHPRERTDYKKYFPDILVIEEKFPWEIMDLLGVKMERAVTIFSSGVYGMGENIDFYGTEIDKTLFKKYGHCNLRRVHEFSRD